MFSLSVPPGFDDEKASWRKMQIGNPPIKTLRIMIDVRSSFVATRKSGFTFGELVNVIQNQFQWPAGVLEDPKNYGGIFIYHLRTDVGPTVWLKIRYEEYNHMYKWWNYKPSERHCMSRARGND